MLANSFSNTFSTGTPNFIPSFRVENLYEQLLLAVVPFFIDSFKQHFNRERLSEPNISQNFGIVLDRYIKNNDTVKLCVRDNTKDIYTSGANDKKSPDFIFFSSDLKSEIKPLYTVEAKRLPTGTGKREKEYIYGLFESGSPSGGIHRFKTGDHGYGLLKSGLLGYIEKNDFDYWHNTINQWIADKANELPKEWKEEEKLQQLEIDSTQSCSISRSVAYRTSDTIDLFHLWIKIPQQNITT